MSGSRASEVSMCLADLGQGDRSAVDRLLPHVYADLREMAGRMYLGRAADRTMQPTALVHEAYMRLVAPQRDDYESRLHFMSVAAMAMRQILASYARDQRAQRRGGGKTVVLLTEADAASKESLLDLVALDDALTQLQTLNERQARTVELRFLAGLTVDETAEVLGVSPRTVKADWQMARGWLNRALS
ncbi:MAG: ECF-type sigma factor [Planctomycetota bacterium]